MGKNRSNPLGKAKNKAGAQIIEALEEAVADARELRADVSSAPSSLRT